MTDTQMRELKSEIMSGEIGINEARKRLGLPPIENAVEIERLLAELREKGRYLTTALSLTIHRFWRR